MPWGSPAFKFGNSSSHESRQNMNERPSDRDRSRNYSDIHSNSSGAPPSRFQQVPFQSTPSSSTPATFGKLPVNSSSSSTGALLTEDHEPNLANSRRLQGPPSVIATRPPRILNHARLKRPPTSPSKHGHSRYKPNPYKSRSPIKRGGSHKRIYPKQANSNPIIKPTPVAGAESPPPKVDATEREMPSEVVQDALTSTSYRQQSSDIYPEEQIYVDSDAPLSSGNHEHMEHSPSNDPATVSEVWKEEQDIVAPSAPSCEAKEEPISYRLPSPIDVDTLPQTLYEQLGLPLRKSGAYRALHPRFKKSQQGERDKWAAEIAEQIRWVRGKETGLKPLKVGRVLWRSDGVSFDWELPSDDELEMQADITHGTLIPMQDSELSFLGSPRTSSPEDMRRFGSSQRNSPLCDNQSIA
ncbi:493_t:CDS:2, partial [Acaulospora colombiana]